MMTIMTTMFTVRKAAKVPSASQRPPWLIVESEGRLALLIENILSKLGWSTVGPVESLEKAVPLARELDLGGAVIDLDASEKLVYPVAQALANRGIPFVFISALPRPQVRDDFRDRPVLAKRFLMERLRPLIRGVLATA
jgi:CheY-like chemotaxis protein